MTEDDLKSIERKIVDELSKAETSILYFKGVCFMTAEKANELGKKEKEYQSLLKEFESQSKLIVKQTETIANLGETVSKVCEYIPKKEPLKQTTHSR